MSGTHGELYSEIGQLVVAANSGQALDLAATSEALSQRYDNLNVSPEVLARAIARSLGAVGVSMALLNRSKRGGLDGGPGRTSSAEWDAEDLPEAGLEGATGDVKATSLFPSGVRLALLS